MGLQKAKHSSEQKFEDEAEVGGAEVMGAGSNKSWDPAREQEQQRPAPQGGVNIQAPGRAPGSTRFPNCVLLTLSQETPITLDGTLTESLPHDQKGNPSTKIPRV